MADFLTLVDNVARVIGGTAPDATNRPRFFSGDQAGDSTGLAPGAGYPTFKGCYSVPPDFIPDVPCGIILVGPFENVGPKSPDVYTQGVEHAIDNLRLIILISRQDAETTFANLAPYRDLVPAAFAAKMTAFSTANVLQIMCRAGKPGTFFLGGAPPPQGSGIAFDGLEFQIRVIRSISRTYVS
jgi:hypothetical protein